MVVSMTGYAYAEFDLEINKNKTLKLSFEAKSLNSRYLDTNVRIPELFSSQESELAKIFRTKLIRGKIFFSVRETSASGAADALVFNQEVFTKYLEAFSLMKDLGGAEFSFDFINWASLPKLFSVEGLKVSQTLNSDFMKKCSLVIDALIKQRSEEGKEIATNLKAILENIKEQHQKIISVSKNIVEQLKEAVSRTHQELSVTDDKDINHHVLVTKYTQAQDALNKSDVNEETSRLQNFCNNLQTLFDSSDTEIGKKMDFTLQEMLRETNTIASKISDIAITQCCIEIKFGIEKLKEQAQNLV